MAVISALGDLGLEQPHGRLGQLGQRLAHRGDRHRGGRGEIDVVVPDDRDVLRHADVVHAHQAVHHADGDHVVRAEDPVRPQIGGASAHEFAHPGALRKRQVVGVDDLERRVWHLAHRPARAFHPVVDLSHRAADQGEPTPAAVQQVAHGEVTASLGVEADGAEHVGVRVVAEDDHRHPALMHGGEVRRHRSERGDHDPAHPLLLEHGEVVALPVLPLRARREKDAQAALLSGGVRLGRERAEELAARRHDHEPDRGATAALQLSGAVVGDEAQLVDRLAHGFDVAGRDGRNAVDDVRDGAHRYAGMPRDVADAHTCHRATSAATVPPWRLTPRIAHETLHGNFVKRFMSARRPPSSAAEHARGSHR
jgi:hypothetical protein